MFRITGFGFRFAGSKVIGARFSYAEFQGFTGKAVRILPFPVPAFWPLAAVSVAIIHLVWYHS